MSRSIPKGWIKLPHRNTDEYKQGVQFFMDFAMKHSLPGLTTCSCPCKRCKNGKRASFEVVRKHLIINGMLPTYDDWSLHGEKPDMDMAVGPKQHFVEDDHFRDEVLSEDTNGNGGAPGNLVDDAYGVHKKIEQCKKKAENMALSKITHTLGRKSYNREEEYHGEDGRWSEALKRAQKNKVTGKVLPCALEKYNELEAPEKRQKLAASAIGHGVTNIEDSETNPIVETFGADKKSRHCAVSPTSSTKQGKIRQATKAIASQNTNPVLIQRLDNLEVMVREVLTYVYTTQQSQNPISGSGIADTESSSNSLYIATTSKKLNSILNSAVSPAVKSNNKGNLVVHGNNGGPSEGKQNVVLLGREREDVAKGFIASLTTCHGREMQDGETIVYVSEVIKPGAPVYDGPQNGISFLYEIADGGYLIWGVPRIRYL
ncbi:uncharacterized protein M6B38_332250 [Iris pallida]|uniref:Transposase-associated domain-containing protein n=1 Tax=Iris pallida TaxID=29817 RepID=A0AAX6H3P3_IRIPA|nr:uncharacterized protein M6B38_332250 [Iris pallida]